MLLGSTALQHSTATISVSPSRHTRRSSLLHSDARRRASLPAELASLSGCYEAEAEFISKTVTGLHDVESVLVALNETSAPCRRCILSTVASVCGDTCAREHLHLMLDEPINATVCVLSDLADILSAAQAASLANAVRSNRAFGLSITLPANFEASGDSTATVVVRDLFLPTEETLQDQQVLRGSDSNHSIFACSRVDLLDTWVISLSRDRSTWARCEGDVWIGRLSGKAQ